MDVFVEQTLTRKNRTATELLYYAAWVFFALFALLGVVNLTNVLYAGEEGGLRVNLPALLVAVFALLAAFLLWRATFKLRTEYDYTFTNGTMDVARVMNGKKRVYLTSFEMGNLRAAGEEGCAAYQSCARESGVRVHRWYLNAEAKKYFFCFDKKGERHLVILELGDEMARAVFNRRYLSPAVWDGAYKDT